MSLQTVAQGAEPPLFSCHFACGWDPLAASACSDPYTKRMGELGLAQVGKKDASTQQCCGKAVSSKGCEHAAVLWKGSLFFSSFGCTRLDMRCATTPIAVCGSVCVLLELRKRSSSQVVSGFRGFGVSGFFGLTRGPTMTRRRSTGRRPRPPSWWPSSGSTSPLTRLPFDGTPPVLVLGVSIGIDRGVSSKWHFRAWPPPP